MQTHAALTNFANYRKGECIGMNIHSMNKSLTNASEDMDSLIQELTERTEFSCTGNTCPVHSCEIVWLEDIIV